ncbi:flagellin [Pseudorhodoplanes sinuspersici]|uniref:Flagellin n=1 Tax=Pseudorhodoplanes sinuspersici TaxID=1235591 RepID=A0A1W6ZTY3_9HYPH|nr:flagellin [Pseudorhodoplanes sinuspersici]ARQ00792.1 hypothetical protein CAK95_18130 [Pseudorhodoplanes sinuspersici]RKE72405.1 flagellin-like hook-associated protein FlgL [Pseudorhodoplanes sinuspersici]
MGDIVLSAGVRKNLLSLQNTADLMALTQNRLATGKKVNTALDNPFNYFTAAALNNRAGDMNALLDAIGQSQKTIEQADIGITAITKLVESAKSLAKQARQTSQPVATYNQTITGAAIAPDVPATATSTANFTTSIAAATASVQSEVVIDATDLATDWADGQTFSLTFGGVTVSFESDTGTDGVSPGNIGFTTAADFATAIQSAFGTAVDVTEAGGTISIKGNFTQSFTVGGTAAAQGTATANVDGDTLTINDGTNTATFRKVAAGAVAADGTFTDLTELSAAVAASSLTGITVADAGGNLQISAAAGGQFTVGGTLGTNLGFAATAYEATNTTLSALAGQSISIQIGSGAAQTFNITAATNRADLTAWLGGLTLPTGVTAAFNASNQIEITSTTSDIITITGTGNAPTTFGLVGTNNGVYTPSVTVTSPSDQRADYQREFNETIAQIDALARDSSYNGVNLLLSDSLKVIFNEDGSSMLNIEGVDFTAAGLGLTELTGDDFQNNITTDAVLARIDTALRTLRTQAATFGTKLGTVETRQNFTKSLIQTLETGADNLVLADTNEEGANMLALQTRQSLSTTALSLSAQADQAVLRLFG